MKDFKRELNQIVNALEQKKQAELAAEIEQQKAAGRCNLIPFPAVATQPFRSELNIEKYPLFVVNFFKEDWWEYTRTLKHPNSGESVIQKITVGKLDKTDRARGVLKQTHQQIFYKLLRLWGEKDYPIVERYDEEKKEKIAFGVIETTVYELVTYLRGNDSAKHYHKVQHILQDLAAIPIVCECQYEWQKTKDRLQFTLLGGISWKELKINPNTRRPLQDGASRVIISFSPFVTEGFLRKNVKQLLLTPYEELGRKAEIARLLYPMLDYELSEKEFYHITLINLEERLGLLHRPSKEHRKRIFTSALKKLNGRPILGEQFTLGIHLRLTKDGDDYCLEAKRCPSVR